MAENPQRQAQLTNQTPSLAFQNFTRQLSGRYLDSGLRQVDLEGHLLPHEDVRIARFGKQRLKDVQLRACEGGALPTLLTRGA